MTTRLSVNINDRTAAALRRMERTKGMSATEIVAYSIDLYEFALDAIAEGKVLKVQEKCRCCMAAIELRTPGR